VLTRWLLRRPSRHGATALRRAEFSPETPAVEELMQLARQSFVQLQAAWDRADLNALAALATSELLAELREQLAQRGPQPNHTEVIQLQARLLSLDDLREASVASVEFSGLIREQLGCAAAPFRELWLLANVKAGGLGWRLARVQSLS
jgi:predicted lipid-binding transport protein (Tim44 family)